MRCTDSNSTKGSTTLLRTLHALAALSLALGCAGGLAACDESTSTGEDVVVVGDTGDRDGFTADAADTAMPDGDTGMPGDTGEDMVDANDTGNPDSDAADTVDPCAGVSNCASQGRRCDGDQLVVCAPDANGCLVESTTDCSVNSGGFCDETLSMPACAIDPCVNLTNGCATPGRECVDETLVECAENAFGCLVETRTDCAASGGTCDTTGVQPVCSGAVDCSSLPNACSAAGTFCDGIELVTCAPDAFGCLVETREDCSDTMNGFCRETGMPQCAISTTDPCDGVTECSPEGRSCAGDVLTVCAPDANGCLIETTTDCTQSGEVCNDTGPMAVCGPACTDECGAAGTSCAGSTLEQCADDDGDGCLELTTTDCAATGDYCDSAASPPACAAQGSGESCADPIVVQGSGGTWSGGNFAADFADDQSFDAGMGCDPTDAGGGHEVVFQVDLAAGETVVVRETGGFDAIRHIVASCTDGAACLESRNRPDIQSLSYGSEMGETVFVIVESFFDNDPRSYEIDIDIISSVCGDGFVSPDETCDDGNTDPIDATDGCSADCSMIATDFDCYPGLCFPAGQGDTCQDPIALDGDTTVTMPTTPYSDTYAGYFGCGVGGGNGPDVVFSVDVADGDVVNAEITEFDFNAALVVADDCQDIEGSCQDIDAVSGFGDVDVEYVNDTGSTQTIFLVVDSGNNNSSTDGTFELDVDVRTPGCGDGFLDSGEECDDGNMTASDGCSPTCTLEGDVCPDAITLSGSTTINADTSAYTDDYGFYGGACGGLTGDGPDVVYSIDVADGEWLYTSMEFANARETLALVTDCADINGTCLAGDNTLPDPREASWLNDTGGTQTVFIIVDGVTGGSDGPYELVVEVATPTCGDGELQGEDCDDGNSVAGDGCTMCTIDMDAACYDEPSFCFFDGDGDTCASGDVIELPGAGVYGGDTSGAYSDDYSDYDGAGCPGSIFDPNSGTGNDMVFSVDVGAGETLDVLVAPLTSWDPAVALVSSSSMACATIDGTTCLDADDNEGGGQTEGVTWTNSGLSTQTVFIIVDGFNGSSGEFELLVDIN